VPAVLRFSKENRVKMAEKSTEVNSKILIDFKEYERLKNIEELYLKSQAKLEKNLRFSKGEKKTNPTIFEFTATMPGVIG
jgi:PHD/YefM family antitoxin component YafN of YafNO toxin-antitoxin module